VKTENPKDIDFSKPWDPAHPELENENVFDIVDGTLIVPGCVYSALLPTGERCNRIMIAGAITDKSKAGDQNVQYRAKVSDPTGIFYINASSYQPEAMLQLAKIDTDMPSFVVVIGKPNAYTTPEGRVLVSVRAEAVQVVDRDTRDLWILDTARATLDRIDVMFGADDAVSPDVVLAKETYPQKADHWKKVVFDALSKLV
jgi:RPA family protein